MGPAKSSRSGRTRMIPPFMIKNAPESSIRHMEREKRRMVKEQVLDHLQAENFASPCCGSRILVPQPVSHAELGQFPGPGEALVGVGQQIYGHRSKKLSLKPACYAGAVWRSPLVSRYMYPRTCAGIAPRFLHTTLTKSHLQHREWNWRCEVTR